MGQKVSSRDSLQSARKNQVLNLKIDKVTVILDFNSPLVAYLPCSRGFKRKGDRVLSYNIIVVTQRYFKITSDPAEHSCKTAKVDATGE